MKSLKEIKAIGRDVQQDETLKELLEEVRKSRKASEGLLDHLESVTHYTNRGFQGIRTAGLYS